MASESLISRNACGLLRDRSVICPGVTALMWWFRCSPGGIEFIPENGGVGLRKPAKHSDKNYGAPFCEMNPISSAAIEAPLRATSEARAF